MQVDTQHCRASLQRRKEGAMVPNRVIQFLACHQKSCMEKRVTQVERQKAGEGGGRQPPPARAPCAEGGAAPLHRHLVPGPCSQRAGCAGAPSLRSSPPGKLIPTWNLPHEYYAQKRESKFLALDRGSQISESHPLENTGFYFHKNPGR